MTHHNTDDGFEAVVEPAPIPYQEYLADMEGLHAKIGGSPHIGEPTRNALLGWIEGLLAERGATELSPYRAKRQEINYALKRAQGQAVRTDISNEQAVEKIREELGPLLARPKKGK